MPTPPPWWKLTQLAPAALASFAGLAIALTAAEPGVALAAAVERRGSSDRFALRFVKP